jgi:hypothetical protein
VLHHGLARVLGHVPVAERQEGHGEHHPGRHLARVVEVAEVGHLEGAELDAVQVLLVLGERLAVVHLDREFAAGPLADDLADLLDAGVERALLAPGGVVPLDLGSIDRLGFGGEWRRDGNSRRQRGKRPESHSVPPSDALLSALSLIAPRVSQIVG